MTYNMEPTERYEAIMTLWPRNWEQENNRFRWGVFAAHMQDLGVEEMDEELWSPHADGAKQVGVRSEGMRTMTPRERITLRRREP